MLLSNQFAATLPSKFDIQGVTDITGFGLAGHLLEMLRSAQVSAMLRLSQIPLLPGAAELFAAGVESTLAPDNRLAEEELEVAEKWKQQPGYTALFDPQTCGGLLMGVPEQHVSSVLAILAQQSQVPAAVVGCVVSRSNGRPQISCVE
jgi:selenide,water dikinase